MLLENPENEEDISLNPCFSGSWLARHSAIFKKWFEENVLILVLVEVG